ncbi:uncharacterized protein LOC128723782 [Anopheles nili]|uniref:uncharacterized protein LOC128723782 n=1 Tax=Anopheles nili TaxID=185578 RepID=UPI00237C1497|nr:uncharacterized protein LOC128723782 [Anopheles nili]
MRGYEIGFMNMDLLRDHTYDVAIGQTIARRHNGTFQLMMGFDPDQCIDYDHMLMYMGPGYYIPLPAMSAMCFIVPKSGPKSVFLVLLDPYDRYSWAAFGVTIGVVALALTLFGESSRTSNFVLVLLELLMIVLNGPTHQLAGRFERYVVGLFMLLGIVLISGYQSLVISFMASARYEPQLDSIERINDTCLFVHSSDMVRAGYRFKNIIHSLDIFASSQLMWELKWCSVAACTEAQYVMEHVGNADKPREPEPGELMLYDQEQWGMMKRQLQLFRYSKAHMQTSTSLYRAGFNSPVRHLVHWYTQAFIEGCLHHYPVLRKTPPKAEVILQDTLEAPGVKRMGLTDLVIGWALFCLGIGLSAMSFAIELGIVGARKLKHIIRVRIGRKKRAFIRL